MLKWYAETFKLTEKQMTTRALRDIKILTVLSFLAVPIFLAMRTDVIPVALTIPAVLALIFTMGCFFCLCFTKFVNRFWARDKYLDEWERGRKHQSMAFAFQVLLYGFGTILVGFIIGDMFGMVRDIEMPVMGFDDFILILASIFIGGLMIMHLYLLATTKPIDEGDTFPDTLAPDEIV
ncbi:hypothetical protein [Fretibacter rubidus]|uniref:hypothetical protein n=1 Tax=Fretibacter rubidus TaxID=570162 RepID=UPI00352BCC84